MRAPLAKKHYNSDSNKIAKAYNARVKPRNFQVGDLVMRKAEAFGPAGKLDPKWEDSYKLVEIVNGRAYKLQQLDGMNIPRTWNITNSKNSIPKFAQQEKFLY
ncbi:UNVERIFIED_CONTAM: hypothetical protein Slati_0125800 [Sesamum latifolium]|uniref:Reverse transcriptase domain-containing protein n=1 Tax=Sesamum latifolium TaxID=2727402 RepID=A0AAW2YAC9_9LAMI